MNHSTEMSAEIVRFITLANHNLVSRVSVCCWEDTLSSPGRDLDSTAGPAIFLDGELDIDTGDVER